MPSPCHIPHYTYLDYEKWSDDWELIDGIPFSIIFKGGTFERELQFCQECKVNIKFQL